MRASVGGPALAPDALDGVEQGVVAAADAGREGVALAAEEALAGEDEVDGAAAAGEDVVGAEDLGVEAAAQKPADADVGQWQQVVFVVAVDVDDGVADLAHLDRAGKGHLDAGIAVGPDAVGLVGNVHGRDGRVVADLLGHETRRQARAAAGAGAGGGRLGRR